MQRVFGVPPSGSLDRALDQLSPSSNWDGTLDSELRTGRVAIRKRIDEVSSKGKTFARAINPGGGAQRLGQAGTCRTGAKARPDSTQLEALTDAAVTTYLSMPIDIDIETPADRKRALRAIAPEDASSHHSLLRRVFTAEVEFRRRLAHDDLGDDDWDPAWGQDENYFENVYWCAWLLFLVGDPTDVPAMWHAKYEVEFDLQCGFDTESMLGGDPARTVAWLRENGMHEIADGLAQWCRGDCREQLARWSADRRHYFLGN